MKNLRNEIKFTLNNNQIDLFKISLINQLNLKKKYQSREITSLYLDDINFLDAKENLIGISDRKKIRLRIYNRDFNNINLEKKIKINKYNYKETCKFNFTNNINLKYIRNVIFSDNNVRRICGDNQYFYAIGVKYKRNYYENFNGLRVTFDTNINFCLIQNNINFNNLKFFQQHDLNVTEIKYLKDSSINFNRHLLETKRIPTRNSKYLRGLSYFGLFNYI